MIKSKISPRPNGVISWGTLGFVLSFGFLRGCIYLMSKLVSLQMVIHVLVAWTGIVLAAPVPDDFPSFLVPGCEKEMASLRSLFWLHYEPAGPSPALVAAMSMPKGGWWS